MLAAVNFLYSGGSRRRTKSSGFIHRVIHTPPLKIQMKKPVEIRGCSVEFFISGLKVGTVFEGFELFVL